jgi:hypothetical protein
VVQNHDISKKGGPTSEWRSEPLFPCPRSGEKHVVIRLVNSISHFNKPELSGTTGQPSEQFNNYLLGKIVPNLVKRSTSRRKVCEQFCTLYQSLLLQKCWWNAIILVRVATGWRFSSQQGYADAWNLVHKHNDTIMSIKLYPDMLTTWRFIERVSNTSVIECEYKAQSNIVKISGKYL